MRLKKIRIFTFVLLVAALSFIVAREYEQSHQGHDHHDHEEHAEGNGTEEVDNHEHKEHAEEEETSGSVGPGKAVEEVHEESGIRLSTAAMKRLGVKTMPVSHLSSPYPVSALVKYQEEIGIYRYRQGWFKLIPSDSTSFQPGDEIVVYGAALLRAAELDAFGGGEEGHGH